MNKEKYNEIIDKAYDFYQKEYEKDNSIGLSLLVATIDGRAAYRKPDREMFIGLCAHSLEFSNRWGLKIEERELSLEERVKLTMNTPQYRNYTEEQWKEYIGSTSSPRKLITVSYKNEKIEVYE
jgi:hypothetical protein